MDSKRSVVDTSALHLHDMYAPPQDPHHTGHQCSLCHNTQDTIESIYWSSCNIPLFMSNLNET